MSSPAHSLHVAVAAPATIPLVRERPDSRRDASKLTTSVFCCATYNLASSTSRSHSKNSGALGFAFLCSPNPVWPFHLETTGERSTGCRGACLLAFPHERECGIAGGCFMEFALSEDLFEEVVSHETHVELS